MYNIDLTSFSFPQAIALPPSFQFSKAKLAWAAITTGKPNRAATRRHAGFSYHEMLFRWNLVLSSLNFLRADGYLENSVLFNDMDPSEKGGLNFFLGMAFAKIAAQDLLDVPWLAHYSWFQRTGQITWQPSRSTADLIGQNATTREYVVIEAKGRNNHQYGDALNKAVRQAKQNYYVNNVRCSLHIGSVLYREPVSNRLALVWEDPEPERKDGILRLEMDRDFWREYYAGPWDFWKLQQENPALTATVFGFRIEIHETVRRLIENLNESEKVLDASIEELFSWSKVNPQREASNPFENWSGDGIFVKVLE